MSQPLKKFYDKLLTNRMLGNYCLALILLLSFSHPILPSLGILLGFDYGVLAILLRAIYSGIALFLAFVGISQFIKKPNEIFTIGIVFILAFWAIYSCRLVYDVLIRQIDFDNKGSFYIMSYAWGGCLIPILAVILNIKHVEIPKLTKGIFIIVFIANVLLFGALVRLFGFSSELLLTRLIISDEESSISPIFLSYYGSVMGLLSLNFLLFSKQNIWKTIFYTGCIIFGALHLLLGASRGPMMMFGAGALMTIAIFLSKGGGRLTASYLRKLIVLLIGLGAMIVFVITRLLTMDLAIVKRFTYGVEHAEKEERYYQWESAWEQFLSSPVWGDKYIQDFSAFHPHNILLEVLMSTGIIGGTFFFLAFAFFLLKVFKIFGRKYLAIFPFTLVAFINVGGALLSGCLWLDPGFWILFTIVIAMPLKYSFYPAARSAGHQLNYT